MSVKADMFSCNTQFKIVLIYFYRNSCAMQQNSLTFEGNNFFVWNRKRPKEMNTTPRKSHIEKVHRNWTV